MSTISPGCEPKWRWRSRRPLTGRRRCLGPQEPVRDACRFDLTIIAALAVAYFLPMILNWMVFSAQWTGADRTACLTQRKEGTPRRLVRRLLGLRQQVRPVHVRSLPIGRALARHLTAILFVGLLAPLLIPRAPYKGINVSCSSWCFRLSPSSCWSAAISACPMSRPALGRAAGDAGDRHVGIVVSLPLGIAGLGRRSKMPAIKLLSVIFIEAVRGVPLDHVLFMASFMLPLFLPPGMTFDKLLRALIGVALFASAYMAEVIRGGLQAIPRAV
jgi:general L-amino acid transport system permease protein